MLATKKFEKIKPKDYLLFFFSSFFNPFLYFIGENYGLDKVSASVSAFIVATIPYTHLHVNPITTFKCQMSPLIMDCCNYPGPEKA